MPQPQLLLPRRIHIIGVAGSGKTTLARQLAARLNAPCFDLDIIGYEQGAGEKRPLDRRLADIQSIVAQPAWITEGAFLWWIGDLLEHADTIVWLDVAWPVAYWRIVKRHIKADLARSNRHPGFRKMLRFAKGVRPYCLNRVAYTPASADDDGANRAAVEQALSVYQHKVVRCRSSAEVRAFLKQMRK